MSKIKTAISPTRAENYPEWYQQVIKAADMAENSVVRGCMVIKPWGYAIWENIQAILDNMIKDTGHENFYCPLFVPLSFLEKEAAHVDGFAKECAVVTHHRLETNQEGKLVPAGELEEPLVIRPTSEAIIGDIFSKWVQSYRDLPLLTNQWANVVRWEMRTRVFLRTTEFLWQEGHTAHETEQEAQQEALQMLGVYQDLAENYLAMPVIIGKKTEQEKFPGAETTYTFEAMMQDGKALQAGTSHFLGQNFAKAFNIKYLGRAGKEEFAYTTSWGTTTRLIGSLVMCHADDDGLRLPPKISPLHVVILPLIHKDEQREEILAYCQNIKSALKDKLFANAAVKVKIDNSDIRAGEKSWKWVKRGVPLRVEIGNKEITNQTVFLGRRDQAYKDKVAIELNKFIDLVPSILDEIQSNYLTQAKQYREQKSKHFKSSEEFFDYFNKDKQAGFASAYWIGDDVTEQQLQQQLKVTARVIPMDSLDKSGKCIFTGQDGAKLTVFAKSY